MSKKINTYTNKYQIGGEVKQVGSADQTLIKGLELDKDIVDALVQDDPDPMFVTVEVIRPEKSGNNRFYSVSELRSIEQQINSKLPNGYQGHIKTEDRDVSAPDAVTQWLKATIIEKDGKPTLFAKGYVFANQTKFREYLKKSIALRKNVAVSVYGTAKGLKNKLTGAMEVIDFKLESIDWARYMTEGMQGQIVPIIAKEQQEEILEEVMTKEELLQALKDFAEKNELTADEVVEAVPSLNLQVKTDDPTPTPNSDPEPQDPTPAPNVDENGEVVKEMQEVISEMEKERDELLSDYMEHQLEKTFANEKVRRVMRPLVVAEMTETNRQSIDTAIETVANSEENKEIIAEMTKQPMFNPLNDNRKLETPVRKYTKVGVKK